MKIKPDVYAIVKFCWYDQGYWTKRYHRKILRLKKIREDSYETENGERLYSSLLFITTKADLKKISRIFRKM
jgi:hypothetical protein